MMNQRNRLKELEGGAVRAHGSRPYVWVRPGQSLPDALAQSGLPDDGRNEFFSWRV